MTTLNLETWAGYQRLERSLILSGDPVTLFNGNDLFIPGHWHTPAYASAVVLNAPEEDHNVAAQILTERRERQKLVEATNVRHVNPLSVDALGKAARLLAARDAQEQFRWLAEVAADPRHEVRAVSGTIIMGRGFGIMDAEGHFPYGIWSDNGGSRVSFTNDPTELGQHSRRFAYVRQNQFTQKETVEILSTAAELAGMKDHGQLHAYLGSR